MKANKLKENLDNPQELERLYRSDKKSFENEFYQIYQEVEGNQLAGYWKVRLDFDKPQAPKIKFQHSHLLFLIVSCVIAGFLIKLPAIFSFSMNDSLFYERNAALIIFAGLSLYTILTAGIIKKKHIITTCVAFLLPAIYVNLLPLAKDSHSVNLVYIHLPLLLWCIYGLIFIGFDTADKSKRIDFIKFNGDLAVLMAIILIAGGILAAITVGLFAAIDIKVERFYMDYIAVWGVVSAPMVAYYIIRNFRFVTNKIAPIIANIFSPLVLITLVAFMISIPIAGKDPYNDRDFLLIFNLMLLGVMGIIVFAVSESSENKRQKFTGVTLFLLAVVAILIDLVALSAIIYRLGEFGFSPNKTAVLGSNLLIFGNLVLIMVDLYKVNFRNSEIKHVEMIISRYLPLYIIWTLFVVFGFPLIFGMK